MKQGIIAHFVCRTLDLAKKLLDAARLAGLRNSGIALGNKVTVQLRGTSGMELPLTSGAAMMVSEAYVEWVVKLANDKFEQNARIIEKLMKHHTDVINSI